MGRFDRERREIHPLPPGYYKQKASSIRLVPGVVTYVQVGLAQGYKVLCPLLAQGDVCRKGEQKKEGEGWYRPRLLVKNYGDPSLQLWSCQGCVDKFLVRVIINNNGR